MHAHLYQLSSYTELDNQAVNINNVCGNAMQCNPHGGKWSGAVAVSEPSDYIYYL